MLFLIISPKNFLAFMWSIIRNTNLTVLDINNYMLRKFQEAGPGVSSELTRTRLLCCSITEALKQNSPERFKEVAFAYACHPGLFILFLKMGKIQPVCLQFLYVYCL